VNKKLAQWASSILVVAGVVLVGAFFLDWIRDWGEGGSSGWRIARDGEHWLYAIPVSGLALALAAGSRASVTRLVALACGLLVAGDFAYHLLRDLIHSNLTTYMLLGGAAITLVGIPTERRALRAVGGAAVLLALFAPWESHAGFSVAVSISLSDLFSVLGIATILVYAAMLGAVVAIVSAFTTKPWGKTAALVAGLAVFAAYFWLLLAVANMFFAWGAWLTLGASTAALGLAVLAPAESANKSSSSAA
jgi:hypothetical protein